MDQVTIGTLARRTGVNIETIRYYERHGIMPAPARSAGGHRMYDEDHVKRLGFVRRCRDLGFGLDSVRDMLRMVDDDSVTCEQVKRVAESHLADVRAKLADLKRMERSLSETVARCDGGEAPDCPILETLYDPASR